MSPLPTSLIVVGLVAAWLVVLVPMVAKRREHVPESDEDSAGFRVLRRASKSTSKRRPVLSRTAVAADADDRFEDGDLFEDGDALGQHADEWDGRDGEEDGESGAEVVSARIDAEFGGEDPEGPADARNLDAGDERIDDLVDEGETRFGGDEFGGDDDADLVARIDPGDLDDRWGDVEDSRHRRPVRDAADEWTAEHPQRRRADSPPSAPRPRAPEPTWQADPGWGGRDRGDDAWDGPREPVRGARHEVQDEARLRPVPIRPGRGGFDPRAAELARAFRYRQRRRIVLLLLALVVVGAVVGVLGIALAWAGAVVAAVLLAMYLAYLRRQVRIEESIRQRRAARLERARQIRPAYRVSVAEQVRAHRTGSLLRPDAEEEPEETTYRLRSHAHPTSTVPPAFHTRGVPVDLDDDDPAFDDLEYYRPVTYRRAVGE